MKKIILFLLLFLSFGNVFAEDISVQIDSNVISSGEVFEISIEMSDMLMDSGNIDISIPGIENFDIFAQSKRSSTQIINGETSSVSILTLSLMARDPGNYTLGPVSYESNGEVVSDDEVFGVEVIAQASQQGDIPVIERDERVTKREEIRPLREVAFPYIALGALFLAFIVLFYFALQSALSKNKIAITQKSDPIIPTMPQKSYKKKLDEYYMKLQGKMDSISSREFYRYYNAGLRDILMYEGFPQAQNSTLKELQSIKNIHSHEAYKIILETYNKEFQEAEIDTSERQHYIDTVLTYLRK